MAAGLWFGVSLAALVFVVREDYAVGLDFEGGSRLELVAVGEASGGCDAAELAAWLRARDPAVRVEVDGRGDGCQVHLRGITDAAQLDAMVAGLAGRVPALREERRIVVPSGFAPGFGRPLVEGVGWAAALGWPVVVALRSRGLAIFAAAVSTVAVGLAWLLWQRATLGLAVDLAALWFAPAIALIVGCAARTGGSAGPLVRAWPGWLALALLWGAAATVHAIDPVSTAVARWPYVGARLAQTLVVPVAALGLLAAWTLRAAPTRVPPAA